MGDRPRGRPPRIPTVEECHSAAQMAKGAVRSRSDGRLIEADIERIAEAVGIPAATYRQNRDHPRWEPFCNGIRRAHAEAVVKVAGARYLAAISDDDTTRGTAREGYLKQNAGWRESLEVTGAGGTPLMPVTRTIKLDAGKAVRVRALVAKLKASRIVK